MRSCQKNTPALIKKGSASLEVSGGLDYLEPVLDFHPLSHPPKNLTDVLSSLRMSFSLITKSRDAQAYLNYIIKDKNDLWKKAHSCLRTCASKRERREPSALIMQQVVRMRPSSALFVLCVHLMYTYTSEGVRECVHVCVCLMSRCRPEAERWLVSWCDYALSVVLVD